MDDILLTGQLTRRGLDADDLSRLCRSGQLRRVRRGAYALPGEDSQTIQDQHRAMIRATVPQLRAAGVVSHGSAAVLHGLPVWPAAMERVHLTRPRTGGGIRRSLVEIHTSPLQPGEVTTIGGVPTTTLARTVADVGRTWPFEQAVAAGDHALRIGLQPELLDALLQRAAGWPGVRQSRRVAGFLDGRSESAGESVSRVRCHEELLPPPTPQFEVYGPDGELIGRCDFGWEEQRTLGEFDGRVKYGRLLRPGETVEQAVYREKLREDALRDLGWQVVRWVWADLYRRGVIRDRLLRAFARTAALRG